MKGFAIVLLFVAAVQGRNIDVKEVDNPHTEAALGENPWVVHLRMAVGSSGFLESCVGALVDNRWVLTTAFCLRDVRFIWVRCGAVEVSRPELVIETSSVRVHENYNSATGSNNIALVNLNRYVEETANIAPIAMRDHGVVFGAYHRYCGYGQGEQDTAVGELLSCWDVVIIAAALDANSVIVAGQDMSVTEFDTGAPLVREGNLIGLLDRPLPGTPVYALFVRTSPYVNWISGVTGVDFGRTAPEGPGT